LKTPSQRQEEQITERLCEALGFARRQPGSGNQVTAPNDVRTRGFHVECKCTENSLSISVKRQWLNEATYKAATYAVPAFVAIRFGDSQDYFILPDRQFYLMVRLQAENDELRAELQGLKSPKV
jgi:hypothetical protein